MSSTSLELLAGYASPTGTKEILLLHSLNVSVRNTWHFQISFKNFQSQRLRIFSGVWEYYKVMSSLA